MSTITLSALIYAMLRFFLSKVGLVKLDSYITPASQRQVFFTVILAPS